MKVAGDRVGRFRIEAFLGEGGIAQVYQVRHELLDTVHALKLLPIARRGLAKRLLQEGRIQAQLQHPNVVSVTDVVEERGQIGLVMEYVEGPSLEQCLREGGAMAYEEAIDLFTQILSGVAAAHLFGVLHRDLKPANVLLAASEDAVVAKVADFGIAKLASEEAAFRAGGAGPMGTPGYMAPEQVTNSSEADVRADVFALGCILYEMFSGHRAFLGRNIAELIEHTLQGRYVPLRQRVPDIAPQVEQTVIKALQVDPDKRFQSCMEMARALQVEDRVIPPRTLPAPQALDPRQTTSYPGPPTPSEAPTRRQPRPSGPATPALATPAQVTPAPADGHPTFDPDGYTPRKASTTFPGDDLPGFGGIDESDMMEDAIPTIHARNFDAAEDTWTGEAEGDAAEFGLPGVGDVPAAREVKQARRQAWAPPGQKAASAPTPPVQRLADTPHTTSPPARRTGPPTGPRSVDPVSAEQPTMLDPNTTRAQQARPNNIGNLPALNPADAIARSLAQQPVPQEKKPSTRDKLDRVAFKMVWPLLRALVWLAAPLAFVAFVVVAIGSFKADAINSLQNDAEEVLIAVDAGVADQQAMARRLIELGADPAVLEPRIAALQSTSDPAERLEKSRDLAATMQARLQGLPPTEDPEVVRSRRELELALNQLQDDFSRYHKAVGAWDAETEGMLGDLVIFLGMASAPE